MGASQVETSGNSDARAKLCAEYEKARAGAMARSGASKLEVGCAQGGFNVREWIEYSVEAECFLEAGLSATSLVA